MVDCIKKIYKQEGLKGFYKGYKSPLYGAMIQNASIFGCYGIGK